MKTEKNILTAFVLNLAFSLLEFAGGMFTGSTAIVSDAIHDMGDAASIGISYFWEKKSKKQPDETYTYGYTRYSVIGGAVTTLILLFGSVMAILNAFNRIIHPAEIHYDGMILLAVIGTCVNFGAAFFTRQGDSLNQKAVNLHMLEDVLGWIVVLVGAVVMRFTDFAILDPLLSAGVAGFLFAHAAKNLKEILDLLLEKVPHGMDLSDIQAHLSRLDGVLDVHHIHLWSLDGQTHYATMHIVTDSDAHTIKEIIRAGLAEHGIVHAVLELETAEETCCFRDCHIHCREKRVVHHH